jgi:hypothetical protein
MKKTIVLFCCLLAVGLGIPTIVAAKAANITAGVLIGGGTDALDKIECEDILGDDTNRAIATGDRAFVTTTTGSYFCVYDSTGTDSESTTPPVIIVPDDQVADCSSAGQWDCEMIDEDTSDLAAGISGMVKGEGDGSGYSAAVDGTDYVKSKFAANTDINEKIPYEDYYACDDTCISAGAVDLSAKGIHVKFDDSGTDEDTIDDFTNQTAGAWYHFSFIDEWWTIDFSGSNLYGHNGLDWEPTAGDSMLCYSVDGTYLYCQVSRPTALAVSMYYGIPLDSTPDGDDRWHGPTTEYENGESTAISQWQLVHKAPGGASQAAELLEWDADDATYKKYKPVGVVVESGGLEAEKTSGTLTIGATYILDDWITNDDFTNVGAASNADGVIFVATGTTPTTWTNSSVVHHIGTVGIIGGIARNDGWTFVTDNTDEGKTIYGSDTPGALTDVAPATAGDIVCAVGTAIDDDEIQFNFGLCATVEVGS